MFVCVTDRQPHFVTPLPQCDGTAWDVKMDGLGGTGSFGYHGFTLTKAASTHEEETNAVATGGDGEMPPVENETGGI